MLQNNKFPDFEKLRNLNVVIIPSEPLAVHKNVSYSPVHKLGGLNSSPIKRQITKKVNSHQLKSNLLEKKLKT